MVTENDQVAEGDKVVTHWNDIGIRYGEFVGVPVTSKAVVIMAINNHRGWMGKSRKGGSIGMRRACCSSLGWFQRRDRIEQKGISNGN